MKVPKIRLLWCLPYLLMQLKYNLEGYFVSGVSMRCVMLILILILIQDADNLQKINKAAISRGIVESCSVLLYLNDETLESEWCRCVLIRHCI